MLQGIFFFLAYTVKFGMIWSPGEGAPFKPPFFKMAGPAAWLSNMILAVYSVLGMYLWKAASKPKENKQALHRLHRLGSHVHPPHRAPLHRGLRRHANL